MSALGTNVAPVLPWQARLLELYTGGCTHVHLAMPRAPGKALAAELVRARLVLEGRA